MLMMMAPEGDDLVPPTNAEQSQTTHSIIVSDSEQQSTPQTPTSVIMVATDSPSRSPLEKTAPQPPAEPDSWTKDLDEAPPNETLVASPASATRSYVDLKGASSTADHSRAEPKCDPLSTKGSTTCTQDNTAKDSKDAHCGNVKALSTTSNVLSQPKLETGETGISRVVSAGVTAPLPPQPLMNLPPPLPQPLKNPTPPKNEVTLSSPSAAPVPSKPQTGLPPPSITIPPPSCLLESKMPPPPPPPPRQMAPLNQQSNGRFPMRSNAFPDKFYSAPQRPLYCFDNHPVGQPSVPGPNLTHISSSGPSFMEMPSHLGSLLPILHDSQNRSFSIPGSAPPSSSINRTHSWPTGPPGPPLGTERLHGSPFGGPCGLTASHGPRGSAREGRQQQTLRISKWVNPIPPDPDDGQHQAGEQELATKMLQIQSKRFYIDVKQNRRGRFMKVAEIGADGRRNQIFLALSTAAEFRDHLSIFSEFYSNLGPPNPDTLPEDGKLKSETMVKDNRRYYLDLKENSRGRFLRVSQTIARGGPRCQIAIPAQGMIEFRDALQELLEEFGTDDGGFKGELPEGRHMRVENKNFYFDIGQNNRGIYMRISEVKTNFRTAITIPEKSWSRFRDIFADYVDKMKEGADKSTTSDSNK